MEKTTRTGQPQLVSLDKSAWTGRMGQDHKYMTAKTGRNVGRTVDMVAGAGQLGQICPVRTTVTGGVALTGQMVRTSRTGQLE